MPTVRHPRGGLVSWGSFTFRTHRSKPLSGSQLTTQGQHAVQAGTLLTADRYAHGVSPADYLLLYEYVIHCGPGDAAGYVQDHYDALTGLWYTNQTQPLTVLTTGATPTPVTGQARLEDISETSGSPVYIILNLRFYCENGLV